MGVLIKLQELLYDVPRGGLLLVVYTQQTTNGVAVSFSGYMRRV